MRGPIALSVAFLAAWQLAAQAAAPTAPVDLTDDWVYGGTNGIAHIRQTGNAVSMELSWLPNSAPQPHYKITGTVTGLEFNGSWACVTPVCAGQAGKYHTEIDPGAGRMKVTGTDDPGGANQWNTFVLVRTPKTADSMAKALLNSGSVNMYNILFDTDKASLKPESKATLDSIAALLKSHADLKLEIAGHTDNTGDSKHNQQLSQARAKSVVDALVSRYGISAQRLRAAGYGDTRPVAPNDNERNRANNRRVELKKL